MTLLRGQALSCIKQDRVLFEQIDVSVNSGEILYVRGQNGAGKTSLLRILVGLSEPTEGKVLYQQDDIRQVSETFQRDLVYFGHRLGLNLAMSAIENLQFWCQLNGISVAVQSLYHHLSQLGLVGLEELPVGQLSAGQQRRVALTRLWLKNAAKIWVLDEPFTALDVQGISLLRDKIVQHCEQGGALVITSHQQLDIAYRTTELMLEYQL